MFNTKEIIVCKEHRTHAEKQLKIDGYRVVEVFNYWEVSRCQQPKCCQQGFWCIRAIINHKEAKRQAELINEYKKEQGIK